MAFKTAVCACVCVCVLGTDTDLQDRTLLSNLKYKILCNKNIKFFYFNLCQECSLILELENRSARWEGIPVCCSVWPWGCC